MTDINLDRLRRQVMSNQEAAAVADEIAELIKYAGLLAWIMDTEDDRAEVEDTAVHVWRVSLNPEQHARLARYHQARRR